MSDYGLSLVTKITPFNSDQWQALVPSVAHPLLLSPSLRMPWCRHPFLVLGFSHARSILPWGLSDAVWKVGTLKEMEEPFFFSSPAHSSSFSSFLLYPVPPALLQHEDGLDTSPGFLSLLKGIGPWQCWKPAWLQKCPCLTWSHFNSSHSELSGPRKKARLASQVTAAKWKQTSDVNSGGNTSHSLALERKGLKQN